MKRSPANFRKGILLMIFFVVFGMTFLGFFSAWSQSDVKLVDVHETFERAESDSNVVLLDVRTTGEFNSGHIDGALLIPVQELESRVDELEPYRGKTIIAYCRSGNRSGRAAALLEAHGFSVFNMKGGILKWNAEDLPLVEENEKK